ncbi:MAG: hypothetical protein IID31_02630 [Planctomycetes bacterium]|nr:hypothetical protein [Planctomycetota bacterium]
MTIASRAACMIGMVLLTAQALAQSPDPAQVLARLREKHPGVRILEHTGLVRVVCAQPMTSAATPQLAADDWLRQYVGVFGAGAPELALESSRRISGVLRAVLIPRITHSRSQRALTAIGRHVIMRGNRRT